MPTRIGGEFLVNTTTSRAQGASSVTTLANGGFVVTWLDESQTATVTTANIRAQLFTPAAVRVGGEILVNTTHSRGQIFPSVAALGSGFVVVWQDGFARIDSNVRVQRFDSAGVRIGSEILANTTTIGDQNAPEVTGLAGGNFVVVWDHSANYLDSTNPSDVRGQMFAADGTPVGSEFQVNTQVPGAQGYGRLGALSGGDFVVTWNQGGDVQGQRFAADGSRLGAEFLVNTTTEGYQGAAQIYPTADGGFLVVFVSRPQDEYSILAQKFSASGSMVGGEVTIGGPSPTSQDFPVIVVLPNGGYVVSWESFDGSDSGVYLQEMNAANQRVGGVVLVNTATSNGQRDIAATLLPNGQVMVTWSDASRQGGDSSLGAVKGQLFSTSASVGGATANADILLGGPGADTIDGLAGADTIYAGAGADVLVGGAGDDWLYGGAGDDAFYVDSTGDLAFEGLGEGTDTVVSTVGYYLWANIENLTLASGAGDIFGVGNGLNNVLTGNGGANLLIGGGGGDTLWGGAGNDSLFGQDGDDVLNGQDGVDYLVGGLGGDVLDGGAQGDALYGQEGNDTLSGGTGFFTDILVGGEGDDVLHGDSGVGDYDRMDGGSGDDVYYVDTPDDLTFEAAGGGTDTVIAAISGAGYYLYANVENLSLQGATPFGVGNELANVLTGSATGNYLLGGAGNDTLNGKGGYDVLFGEAGADVFVFERGAGGDVIGDFAVGVDRIDLRGLGFSSFAQVQAVMTQNGNLSAIDLGLGDFVVIHNVAMSSFTAGDFIL